MYCFVLVFFSNFVRTRSLDDAEKTARRVWRSVKVIEHSTVPYARYSFLLCNTNFVFKTSFLDIFTKLTSKNVVTLKLGLMVTQVIESGIIR